MFQVELEGCYYQPLFGKFLRRRLGSCFFRSRFENNMNNAHG
ncbi:unnamed protein product [Cuscuta europaea]|uniref:Uncharacterized protein n=1 Tax=Cuscuta europaea TaxID=41803 RepID=A0A9P1EJN9_CUSEU|nr:unnamed protein product [Cuscuta europaea]